MNHFIRQHGDAVNEPSRNFAAKWRWKIAFGEKLLQYSTFSLSAVRQWPGPEDISWRISVARFTVTNDRTVVDGEFQKQMSGSKCEKEVVRIATGQGPVLHQCHAWLENTNTKIMLSSLEVLGQRKENLRY
jgi:hypothetical protein